MKPHDIYPHSNQAVTHIDHSVGVIKVWIKDKIAPHWQGYLHAELTPHEQTDGSIVDHWNVVEVFVVPTKRKRGLGSILYDTAEREIGQCISPSGELSHDAVAFWLKRDPSIDVDELDDYTYGSFDSYDPNFQIPNT